MLTSKSLLPFHRSAFTLIELLVVISIIALLIGILLPALGSARYEARSLACATQMQQLSRAHAAYSADNDDYITPFRMARPDLGGGPDTSWDDLLGINGYDGRNLGHWANSGQITFIGIEEEFPLYQCPLDPSTRAVPFWAAVTASNDIWKRKTYAITRRDIDAPPNTNAANQNRGVADQNASLRQLEIVQTSNSVFLVEDLRLDTADPSVSRNMLSGFDNLAGTTFTHNPVFIGVNQARAMSHHLRGGDGPASAKQTGYTPNYMYADGHVENRTNESTFEGVTGSWVNGSQWDATAR